MLFSVKMNVPEWFSKQLLFTMQHVQISLSARHSARSS